MDKERNLKLHKYVMNKYKDVMRNIRAGRPYVAKLDLESALGAFRYEFVMGDCTDEEYNKYFDLYLLLLRKYFE